MEDLSSQRSESFLHRFRMAGFAGDVAKLLSGTTLAQLLGILAAPLLTRLYAPDAFGIAAVFTSLCAILGVVASLRYELAIMLPESEEEAANIVALSLGLPVLVSILSALLLWMYANPILAVVHATYLKSYLWLIPISVLVTGFLTVFNLWSSRLKHFGSMSIARVSNSVVSTGAMLGAGYAGYASAVSMIVSRLSGQIISTGLLWLQLWPQARDMFWKSVSWRGISMGFKRYRKFPLFSTWEALLNSISWQLPVFMLSNFFSSEVVGYYALGFRIIQFPMSLIGASIGQVFFQRAAEAKVDGTLANVVEATFRELTKFGLFPMVVLLMVGPEIFSFVLGSRWLESGIYAQILSPWAFMWFVTSPLSTLICVLEKQEFGLLINVFILATRFVSLFAGGMLGNVRIALLLFSASGVTVYGYFLFWLLVSVGSGWRVLVGTMVKCSIPLIPFAGILWIMKVTHVNIWWLMATVIVSGIIYLVYLVRAVPQFASTSSETP